MGLEDLYKTKVAYFKAMITKEYKERLEGFGAG